MMIKANMSSGGSGIPAGRDPHKDGDDRHAEKGDNYGDGQSELQMSGSSSGYQTTPNQQQTLTQKGRLSAHVGFTYGKSDQIISDPVSSTYKNEDKRETTNQGVASHNRNSEPQGGLVVMESPEDVLKLPLMTAGKQTNSLPEFRSIDYSGHFKVNVISKGTKKMILKMKTEEEQFVKFCHLFHCDVQLDMVKEVLQSDLKLDVIKGGYPPSVCTQSGASGPVDVTVKTILACFCYQLTAVNISTTPWDIDHVRTILPSLDSYQRGIVIGYEVSGDVATNDWLAGERGSIKSVTETLVQRLGPRSNPVQQSSEYQHIEPDSDAESALIALQERFGRADRGHQQTGQSVSEQEQQQGTDQITERTHGDQQSIRLLTTSQLKAEPNSCRYKPRVDGLDYVPPGVDDSGDSNNDHAQHFSMGDRQVRATNDNELETISSQKVDVNQATVMSDRSGYQQELAEWSGQNVNSPPHGSMSTLVDQTIDRCQGQIGVHRDSVKVQTGGQNAEVQHMSSPTTVDHYTLPQGQLPSTKPDVHHEAETSIITMKVGICRLEENILSCLPLIIMDLRHKFQHVEIDWKKGRHTVAITGDEVDVRQIKIEIDKQLKAVKENKVEIDSKQMKQEALNMFREKSVLDYLTEHIRSLKVACYLTKNEDSNGVFLCIYAADTDIERAVRLVTSSVVCRETELNSTWRLFLESQYVQQELSDLQKEYNGKVSITIQEGLVTVSCTTDIENEVLTTVDKMKDDFFSERTKTVEYTPGGDLTVELCTKVLQNDIQMIEEKYCVKCCPVQNNRKQGWKVTGPCGTVEKACNALKELSTTVTSRHLPIVDKITEDFFRTQTGQDDMARVGQNTGCLVTLLEQEVASSPGTLGQVTSGRQDQVSATEQSNRSNVAGRQWRSGDGRDVALYCGDGRKSTSDVLVQLTQNKGTQAVQFQPYQGRVSITLNLPEWIDGSNKEKDTIRKLFQEIIIMAAGKGYTSLTVLLDDCQQCGWKERKACKLLVRNTLYSLQREHAGPCSCAYFVRDQETFMTLRDVIDASFRDTTQEFLRITDDKDEVALDWEHVHPSDIEEKKAEIVLHKGELAKMASDVIVNTTDTSLKLDYGAVSASILREAGPEIQRECNQYHYHGVKYGEVAVTHGYKLKCEHVFHGALPSYGTDRQLKCMISFLWRCLTEADKKRYSTISFPALGTGNLGYPRDLVAKTMFDTVSSYFSDRKDSSIETVSFVVYPKDTPTVKAFQDEEKKQGMKVLQATTSKPTPPVSERTAQLQLRYGPVDLWVTVGQIKTATADGLLIFWDSTTLFKSTFSCSYFNESINPDGVNQLRSKRTFMSGKGMTVVTGAGSLHFKSVIHCLIKEDTIDLQTVMSALAEADNQNLSSVVLPLGTKEPLSRLKAQFVNQFHDALRQFGRRNKTLRRVEIMFDSVDTYKDTEKYIRSQYPDRLVENQTVTGEEPLGATGGLQTRSMTREANAKQTSDGNSTQTMYRTNLVVAGKLEDTIEKAIQQLKKKISTLQTQHQSELIPSPAGTTTHQNSPKPVQPPDTAPWDSLVKGDYNSSPVAKRTILESMEYEGRRLVLKSKYVPTLEKAVVEDWLKKSGFENFTVIWPFLHDMEALIILQSSNDADKLLQKPSDQYTMNKFPCQVVQILRAPLKAAVTNTIKKFIRPEKICFEIFQASGATWFEDDGICFLEGSLPELQCATFYISNITAGENVHRGFQQISDAYGYGALERTKENNLCHVYPVQTAMKRNVQVKKRPPPGSEILQTKQGVRVFVYQENLLELDVDAIIHGTNCSLDNSWDLAGKIAIAAGPELEKACSNIFHKKGKLNVGDCCVTTAGNLHYKFIIHAVIPVWSYYRSHNQQNNQQNRQICQDDLTRSILNSLIEAGNAGARSVALPAVGNGVVPIEMCTAAYKEAVNLFCKKHQYPAMAEIHFVDQDQDILRKVSDVFLTSKPHVTSPAPPAVQNVKRTTVYPFWMVKSVTRGAFRLSDKLSVCFIKQSFMDTQATALVSIEDERFQSQRYVAKEIEKKAGKKYQKEKEKIQKGKKHPKISDVFHTSAGDLRNVLYVLHVIAPVVDSSTSHDKVLWKGITDSIRACFHQVFRKVDELKLDSVALPSFALGTLQDGQTEELWQICVEEVVKYTKHQKSTSQLTRIILADPSAKTISFLMGLLDSMQQPPSVKGTRL